MRGTARWSRGLWWRAVGGAVETELTPRTSRSRVAQLLGHAHITREDGGEFVDAEEPPVGAARGDEAGGHELLNAGPRRTASASRAREERERDGGGGLEGTPRSGGYWPFYRRRC
jgi:hypothetical protein